MKMFSKAVPTEVKKANGKNEKDNRNAVVAVVLLVLLMLWARFFAGHESTEEVIAPSVDSSSEVASSEVVSSEAASSTAVSAAENSSKQRNNTVTTERVVTSEKVVYVPQQGQTTIQIEVPANSGASTSTQTQTPAPKETPAPTTEPIKTPEPTPVPTVEPAETPAPTTAPEMSLFDKLVAAHGVLVSSEDVTINGTSMTVGLFSDGEYFLLAYNGSVSAEMQEGNYYMETNWDEIGTYHVGCFIRPM